MRYTALQSESKRQVAKLFYDELPRAQNFIRLKLLSRMLHTTEEHLHTAMWAVNFSVVIRRLIIINVAVNRNIIAGEVRKPFNN